MRTAYHLQVEVGTFFFVLGDADIILQRIDGREDADMSIVVATIVIIELRHVALHEYLLTIVVE